MTPGSVGCDKSSGVWFVIDSHFVNFCPLFSGFQPRGLGPPRVRKKRGSGMIKKTKVMSLPEVATESNNVRRQHHAC